MHFLFLLLLPIFSSCSMMPFLVEEVEEGIEFEEAAIKDEIELRSKNKLACEEVPEKTIDEDYYKYHFGDYIDYT